MRIFIVKTFGDNTRIAREYGYLSDYDTIAKLTNVRVKAQTKKEAEKEIEKFAQVWYVL